MGTLSVVMSWKGDSQATAPIGHKASTNVTPVLESIQKQEILAFELGPGVPPEFSFEARTSGQVSLVLKTELWVLRSTVTLKTIDTTLVLVDGDIGPRGALVHLP